MTDSKRRFQASSLNDYVNNGGGLPSGIRPVEPEETRTPVGQQQMESHVLVPLVWAFVPALVLSALVTGVIYRYTGMLDGIIPALVFGVMFLLLYFKRTDRADGLLWKIEQMAGVDLDGDGQTGQPYAPRGIPINHRGQTDQLAMPPRPDGLTHDEWIKVAIALLHHSAGVSRRGINKNSDLSQQKASVAAELLTKRGYAAEGELTQIGYDWLLTLLPDHVVPRLARPGEEALEPVGGAENGG